MIDLRNGDCKEVLKALPDNSVDSIVTDPPYELGFMGKSWDSTGIANDATMWAVFPTITHYIMLWLSAFFLFKSNYKLKIKMLCTKKLKQKTITTFF